MRLPQRFGNTSGLPSASERAASRTSNARGLSGTRCSRFIFMHSAGTVHTRPAVSISSHVASRTSPDRAAVSTRNSNASLTARVALDARTVPIAAVTSRWGNARMWRTTWRCGPRTGPMRSHGLSVRCSIAIAHSSTAWMRWRRVRAVRIFTCQSGVRISSTSAVLTSETDREPMRGNT